MHSATLTFLSPKAEVVHGAISPEVGREIPRTRVESLARPGEFVLSIEAADLSALRAAINSYLRWIKVAEDITMSVGE